MQLMEVAVPTDGWTRAAILRRFEVIQPNRGALRQTCLACVFGQAHFEMRLKQGCPVLANRVLTGCSHLWLSGFTVPNAQAL